MQAGLPRNPNVGVGMSQLCLTQMSVHSLSWFSRSVHTIIRCLETLVQLKLYLWSTDILKIPALFLAVLILLSHPFLSADFKALTQKRSDVIHCSSVGEEGLFQVTGRTKPPRFGELQSQDLDS